MIDITGRVRQEEERRRREEREAHAGKMEALGQLAGGIAHDFNNLLGVILGFGQFLIQDAPPDSPQRRYAERIVLAGQRGRGLVQQILAFSRRAPGEPTDIVVVVVVNETIDLLKATVPSTTTLVVTTAHGGDLPIRGEHSRISQVVLNLCVNAAPNRSMWTISPPLSIRCLVRNTPPRHRPRRRREQSTVVRTSGLRQRSDTGHGSEAAVSDDTRPTVLVVDDTPDNLKTVSGLLKDRYRVKIANGGEKALAVAGADPQPDLILLDVMMPAMDGYEVCRRLKADERTRDIPVIFLTAKAEVEDEELGLRLGGVDYITKPISPPIVLARVETHLTLKAGRDFLRDKAAYLEAEVDRRTREVTAIQDVTILAMTSLAETRDSDTGNHIRRTQHYVKALAVALKHHPRFRHHLDDARIDMLFKSAPLHDIGKVGIPDRILLKPGRFEPHEFEIMKTHTTLGRDAITHAEQALGTPVAFLAMAKEIAYSHQEKWDGSGYPQGLSGDDIPVSARLMAVADVYDALVSRRVYKEGMPHDAAVGMIRDGAGSHFDPDVVAAFLALEDEFKAIAARYADGDQDMARKREYRDRAVE